MPIRFRCAYCNQLMGIARRKAGTVVRCPTCSGQVVVPTPEGSAASPGDAGQPQPDAGGPALFERSDFEQDVFGGQAAANSTAGRGGFAPVPQQPAPLPAPAPAPPPAAFNVEQAAVRGATFAGPQPPPPGIVLSPTKATVLAVFVVVLIGIAFFAGMLVGRS
ncbi:MAG: hypothetical protein L0Z62_51235 [Gemmataceae bacterium]|nr:hypothetical protein [Gemmataceae bacterium]